MPNLIQIVVILGLLALSGWLAFKYSQFFNWPPAQWKRRVLAKHAEFQALIDKANDDPSAKLEERLRKERLDAYLHAIPLERLADYPNIGPKTVEGLKDGGFKRIDQLWSLNWWRSVPGIGEVRAKALTAAAKTIHDDAETKFNAGQCPEGREWLAERDRMRAENRAATEQRLQTKSAAEKALRELQPLTDLAHAVSFGSFLFHQNTCPVNEAVMNRPFPELKIVPSQPANPEPLPSKSPPVLEPAPPPVISTIQVNTPVSPIDEGQLDRMRAYCRFGFVIARADGRVAVAEKKAIRTFLSDLFGQDVRLLRHIDPVIEQCENPPPVEDDAVVAVKAITTAAQRDELMTVARRIADSSGDRNQKEQNLLDRIATALGVGISNPSNTPAQTPVVASEPNFRAALEIDPKVELSPELIRRRFNILTDQYDPKKATSLGPSFVAKAEEMRSAVKIAAEALIAPFGQPLIPAAKVPSPQSTDMRHNPDLDAVFGM